MGKVGHTFVRGMHRCERQIMDLWDAGMSLQAIARTLNMSLSTVRGTVSNLHTADLGVTDRAYAAHMRRGSQALLAAIQQEGRT